eukprot:95506_1
MAETQTTNPELQQPKRDVHDVHPSLANLQGTIGTAKLGLSAATGPQSYAVQRTQPAANLKSGDLRPFKVSGEKNFIILVNNIALFDDKTLTTSTHSSTIALEKDCIVSGTYLYDDNNVVLLGNPYNVYCNATDVEPQDLDHAAYKSHHKESQSSAPNEEPQTQAQLDEFVMVNNEANKPQASEHETHATMHVITMNDETIHETREAHQSVTAEENRPSFIQTLPPKQASTSPQYQQAHTVNTQSGLEFETINANPHRPSTEELVNRRRSTSGGSQQGTAAGYQNMNGTATHPTPQRDMNEYKYFFNHFLYRTLVLSVTLLLVSVLLMPEWFRAVGIESFKSAYGLSAFGILLIFLAAFGSICGGILEIVKIGLSARYKRIFIYFIMGMYVVGGVFYFIGACAVTGSYNALLGAEYAAYGGVWWCQMFYVSLLSIVTGIDLKRQILNRWDLRVTLFVSLFVLDSFILSICSMVIGGKPFINDTFTTLGVMHLLSSLIALAFLVIRLLTVLIPNGPIKTNHKIEFGLMVALLLFIMCCTFTNWALAGHQTLSPTASYYVGMGILQCLMGLFVTFDVSFCQYVIPRLCIKK